MGESNVQRASKTPPRKRLKRTAALSKEKIIKAAITEFALKGLDGARVDEVARRSGVNKTLLYQYVGNKDRLFTAALEATYQTDPRAAEGIPGAPDGSRNRRAPARASADVDLGRASGIRETAGERKFPRRKARQTLEADRRNVSAAGRCSDRPVETRRRRKACSAPASTRSISISPSPACPPITSRINTRSTRSSISMHAAGAGCSSGKIISSI